MPFKKGKSGNPSGRKPGSPNKATTDLKSRVAALMDDQFEAIKADLLLLDPKDRVMAYLRFLEYVLPKQREQKIDLNTLSDDQLDDLLNKSIHHLA
jgi:hypothetical protein